MSIRILLATEYIKTINRFAFVMTALFLVGMILINAGAAWYLSGEAFQRTGDYSYYLPDAWSRILSGPGQLSILFAGILVILLIGQEFPWRTARQNVIDGMSRQQWFMAKLLLTVVLCVLFMAAVIGVGAAFALPHTPGGADLIHAVHLRIIGGSALALFGFASMAFFLAMVIRNPGPALGLFLIWFAAIETLLDGLLTVLSDGKFRNVFNYFPASTFQRLTDHAIWDPALMQELIDMSIEARRPVPTMPNVALLIGLAFVYIAAFIGTSYVNYRRRDL